MQYTLLFLSLQAPFEHNSVFFCLCEAPSWGTLLLRASQSYSRSYLKAYQMSYREKHGAGEYLAPSISQALSSPSAL
jgi:hypothetical protein